MATVNRARVAPRHRPLATLLGLLATVIAAPSAAQPIWHNKPFIALQNGHFQGTVTVAEAKAHGDFGLGAMADLDGEVVVHEGVIYRFGADGVVTVPPDTAGLTFAELVRFQPPEPPLRLPAGTGFGCLGSVVDPHLPTLNAFYAVRIKGTFASVTARTFPRSHEPFPPACKVAQVKFSPFTDVEGTLVGFRAPPYTAGVAPPAYHLHFISKDGKAGGHALDFTIASATIEIQRLSSIVVDTPTDGAFAALDLAAPVTCPTPPPTCPPPLEP